MMIVSIVAAVGLICLVRAPVLWRNPWKQDGDLLISQYENVSI
jgi:hypothetical protein